MVNLVGPAAQLQGLGLERLLRSHSSKTFWHVLAVVMAPAVATIFIRAQRATPGERRKVARLAVAISIGVAPLIAVTIVGAVSPNLNRWLVASKPSDRVWLDLIVLTGLAVTPLLSSFAVIIDRPFPLRTALGWLVRHAVARAAVEALIVAPFVILTFTVYELRDVAVRDIVPAISPWLIGACLAAGAFAIFGRSPVLRALDRFESRRRSAHHQELAQVVERLRMARGVREIAEVLRRELQSGTGAAGVNVLLPTPSGFAAFDGSSLTMDARLGVLLRDTSTALDVSVSGPWFELLPPIDRDWVETHDVAMLAAVKHRDDAVAAMLVLGPKPGEAPFDDNDLSLVTSIAAAAATAWPTTATSDARATADVDVGAAAIAPGAVSGGGPPSDMNAGDDSDSGPRTGAAAVRDDGEAAFECPACRLVVDTLPLGCGCGVAPRLAALPQRVGKHLVVTRRIGAGGMGVVYLAHDQVLGRDVALKTLPAVAHGAIARLQHEARAMAALNHPALATLFGVEVWRRTPILVVEYFPDGTLADRLAHGATRSVEDTVHLGLTLADALAYMHARGVLHRDLKPSNIGMTTDGSAKLLDFGLAHIATHAGAATNDRVMPAGTGAYLPPEALEGTAPSPAFDLWALALVLLECLVGANRFPGDGGGSMNSCLDALDAIVRADPIAPALRPFFERALSPAPARRFQSAEDLQAALTRSAT